MFRLVLVLCVLVCPAISLGQSARYRGKTYTPSSFPRATWCSCGMCQNIRAQWGQQGWGATTPKAVSTPSPSLSVPKQETFKWVNQPSTQTTYVKRCFNGVCMVVPVTKTVDNWVRVPVAKEKPKLTITQKSEATDVSSTFEGTPKSVVPVMISLLEITKGDEFVDVGCGDGRLVIEAAKAGANATGIELVPSIAKQARDRIEDSGIEAKVITADFKSVKLERFTAVALYQYPDTVAAIVKELKPGTRVVSYAHEIPGVECKEVKTSEAPIYFGVIQEPAQKSERKKPVLFGL